MNTKRTQAECCGCGQKSSLSWIKIVLIIGVTALLVTAVMQARGQNTAPPTGSVQSGAMQTADGGAPIAPVQGRVVRLSYVQGQVQISSDGQTQFDQAVANMPLVQGTMIQTGQDGRAEIQLEDGSIVRLAPGSRAQVMTLGGAKAGSLETEISLLSGTGYFDLRPAGGDKFSVDALGLRITSPEASSFRVSWLAQPEQVAVSDGYVRVKHGDDYNVQVNSNETLSIDDADVTRYLLSTGTDSDANDAWAAERDQYLADANANDTGATAGGDMAGTADLNNYGSYYDVPGVGQVWQPYGYDSSWDPYADGYWAWYPWGYTWISAYPWGWAPYHCGYWQNFAGFGWGWVGGGCGVGIWYPIDPWIGDPGGGGRGRGPHRPIWHPIPPVRRLHPIGVPKDHPFLPVPGHPVPKSFRPGPVTILGHPVQPRSVLPPSERRSSLPASRIYAGPAPRFGSGTGTVSHGPVGGPVYGSRAGNPEMGRGAGGGVRSAPAPTYHSAPAPASHSSPPPAASHSESSSKK